MQEKADHIEIVATIVGTPVSAMLAHSAHGISEMPLGVWFILAGLFACAWARPFPRTSGFIGLGTGLGGRGGFWQGTQGGLQPGKCILKRGGWIKCAVYHGRDVPLISNLLGV